MMPLCQNCWNDDTPAVFLGQSEVPAFCEKHLQELEKRIARYRDDHPAAGSETKELVPPPTN